jgi:hypothetical protein
VLRRPWFLAGTIGILLTIICSAYVAKPGEHPYDPNRIQLYAPGPAIQVTRTTNLKINEITRPDLCAGVITDDHRGFPMSMVNRFGPDSCTQNRYLHPVGPLFNILFYTFLAYGIIALWQAYGDKLKLKFKRKPASKPTAP